MRRLTDRLGWKLLALGAAVALWYMYAEEAEVATSIPVAMQFRNLPPDLEIVSEHTERLFLEVRGPSPRVTPSHLARTTLTLDLAQVRGAGEHTFDIAESSLDLPPGVDLLRVAPAQIRLGFERRASKQVPVEVRYAGPPPAGYAIADQSVSPAAVNVTGPASRVDRLEHAFTDSIDIGAVVGKQEFRVPLHLGDPHLRFDPSTPTAVVRVTLQKIP